MTDAEIVARVLEGEVAAKDALAERYGDLVRRYLITMLGDPSAAEELAQETFRRAFARLATLKDRARLKPWLISIAINECRSYFRTRSDDQRPENATGLSEDRAALRRTALSSVLHREAADLLALAIDRLPVLLREAFVLRYVEGLPYADMEELCGAPSRTLHVRAHRAKGLLRRQLGGAVDTWWTSE